MVTVKRYEVQNFTSKISSVLTDMQFSETFSPYLACLIEDGNYIYHLVSGQ